MAHTTDATPVPCGVSAARAENPPGGGGRRGTTAAGRAPSVVAGPAPTGAARSPAARTAPPPAPAAAEAARQRRHPGERGVAAGAVERRRAAARGPRRLAGARAAAGRAPGEHETAGWAAHGGAGAALGGGWRAGAGPSAARLAASTRGPRAGALPLIASVDGSTREARRQQPQGWRAHAGVVLGGKLRVMVEAFRHRPVWPWSPDDAAAHAKRVVAEMLAARPGGGRLVGDLGCGRFVWFAACTASDRFWVTRRREKTAYRTVPERGRPAPTIAMRASRGARHFWTPCT